MDKLIDFILHVDTHLAYLADNYGVWVYAILFIIVFCETGLVVTPFLPGDALLFAAGTMAAIGNMNPFILFFLLSGAAILGNTVNYFIGNKAGDYILKKGWVKQEYIQKTEAYYQKYGIATIVVSRFLPIIRTIAPFVAGLGKMNYPKFSFYNIVGAVAWNAIFIFLGYFLGNTEFVRKNFSLITIGIILITGIPVLITFIREFVLKSKK